MTTKGQIQPLSIAVVSLWLQFSIAIAIANEHVGNRGANTQAEADSGFVDQILEPYRKDSASQLSRCPSAPLPADELRRLYPNCWSVVAQTEAEEELGQQSDVFSVERAGRQVAPNVFSTAGNSRQDLVREVQLELLNRGYRIEDLDGLVGKETRAAVKAFQRDAGVATTGTVDAALLTLLERRAFTGPAVFSLFSRRQTSLLGNAQRELSRYGYYRGPIDGILNPATREAIREFRTVPYEQVYIDGYPRAYEYLSPESASFDDPEPVVTYPELSSLTERPGWLALMDADYGGAIASASAAIRAAETDKETVACAFFARGLAHLQSGDNEAAIRDFSSVLRIAPNRAEAYFNRSIAYHRSGLLEFARRDHRKAIGIAPALQLADRAPEMASAQ